MNRRQRDGSNSHGAPACWQIMCLNSNSHLNPFPLNQKDLEEISILREIFRHMHIACCNMHIAKESILRLTYIVRAGRFKKYHSGWYFWPTNVRNFWLCRHCCFSKTPLKCPCSGALNSISIAVAIYTCFAWAGGTFFPVLCCVSFWFWREIGFGFTYPRTLLYNFFLELIFS